MTYQLTTKEISVEDVFNAIKVDGYDHLRQNWITFSQEADGTIKPVGACLVGQAAINLGASPDSDWMYNNANAQIFYGYDPEEDSYDDDITLWHLKDGLNEFTQNNKDYPETVGEALGDALIEYNDEMIYDADTGDFVGFKYSYEELVQIAHDLMAPYFDQTITVTAVDYTNKDLWG